MANRYLTTLHKELGFPPLPGGGLGGGSPYTRFALVGVFGCIGVAVGLSIGPELPPFFRYLFSVNLVAFLLCAYDKAIAGTGSTRVPELILFAFALSGGSLGILTGMFLFRHKIRKLSFIFLLFLVLSIQIQIVRGTHLDVVIEAEWESLFDESERHPEHPGIN